jgi:thiol-disulfide isomerase/thioredoxin
MKQIVVSICTLLVGVFILWMVANAGIGMTAPDITNETWLNSAPLHLSDLKGKVVLVEFWTFGCSNCRATLPWLKQMHARYAPAGLEVIAIHSPEFDFERHVDAVRANVTRLGIEYPVVLDNDFRLWKAFDNRYWPAFYLIDPAGRIVATRIGELHEGERSADAFERQIDSLAR